MRLITARFLWRNIKYSILIILIVAAVLTPSPDPWNMAVFAAPMLALYLIGIVVAWLAEPKRGGNPAVCAWFSRPPRSTRRGDITPSDRGRFEVSFKR
jgi:Sec-independent protein secretion pathway component TatC